MILKSYVYVVILPHLYKTVKIQKKNETYFYLEIEAIFTEILLL